MPKHSQKVRFANATEENFGRLLHRLRLRWQYEPHTFVLRTRSDGTPALGFTPDFYLPDLGLYFELTTLRQKLVTAKNRKARLLSEQRPDVRLRLLYRHDCQDILRPVRTRKSREALLRKLIPSPPDETLQRAAWSCWLSRTPDSAGCITVLGVRLPLGPEWAGQKLDVWVYAHVIEVATGEATLARFPCSYTAHRRELLWVQPGELLLRPGIEQGRLALPELDSRQIPGSRTRRAVPAAPQVHQMQLPL